MKINFKLILVCLVIGTVAALALGLVFGGFPLQFIKFFNAPVCHTKICPMFTPASRSPQLNLANLVLDGLFWSLLVFVSWEVVSIFRKGK